MTIERNLTIIQIDTMTGQLEIERKLDNNIGGTDHLSASRSVEVSPNGSFLYIAARGGDADINVFSRDEENGSITQKGFYPVPNANVMVMAPDGKHLYITIRCGHSF